MAKWPTLVKSVYHRNFVCDFLPHATYATRLPNVNSKGATGQPSLTRESAIILFVWPVWSPKVPLQVRSS